jgi:hypothetical protein
MKVKWVWTSCSLKTNDGLAYAMANLFDFWFPALANK